MQLVSNKINSAISLVNYNVISILIGPLIWAPTTSTMNHMGEGTRPCPFPVTRNEHGEVTEHKGGQKQTVFLGEGGIAPQTNAL